VAVDAATPAATCAYLERIAAIDGNAGPVARLAQRCAAPALAQ
jgi:hypothetical protein